MPESVPELGLVPMATVTALLSEETMLPSASSTTTITAGVMCVAAVVSLGSLVKASLLAEPGLISKLVLVAPVRAPSAAVMV